MDIIQIKLVEHVNVRKGKKKDDKQLFFLDSSNSFTSWKDKERQHHSLFYRKFMTKSVLKEILSLFQKNRILVVYDMEFDSIQYFIDFLFEQFKQ